MSEWQPIETAPRKHREYVVLWLAGVDCPASAFWDKDSQDWWYSDERDVVWEYEVTHWMPLPGAPE